MLRKTILTVLSVLVVGLVYACFMSIYGNISFDKEKKAREKAVIARLMQIRNAEERFKVKNGHYCGDLDSLIMFVKNDSVVEKVNREGEVPEELMGTMTEADAIRQGLIRRDTVWVRVAELLNIEHPDSIKYIPVGKPGKMFTLRTKNKFNEQTLQYDNLVECRARITDYMYEVDDKRVGQAKQDLQRKSKNRLEIDDKNYGEDWTDNSEGTWYGLCIGDLGDSGNKMSGNWE